LSTRNAGIHGGILRELGTNGPKEREGRDPGNKVRGSGEIGALSSDTLNFRDVLPGVLSQ
jgi:hypothetical protein